MLADLTAWAAGGREVDAVYSIAAMVHVDLQYLMAYLVTAAAVLRPGGKLTLSLATAATDAGFQKLVEDVGNFWEAQADPAGSSKFEWFSGTMVESLLPRLSRFEVDRVRSRREASRSASWHRRATRGRRRPAEVHFALTAESRGFALELVAVPGNQRTARADQVPQPLVVVRRI